MSTEFVFADDALEALRRKYFPRIPWTEAGPIRRRYLVRTAQPGQDVSDVLARLAEDEGFTAPGLQTVRGEAEECLAAFRERGAAALMIFGLGPDAHWCDLALGAEDSEGWRELIVRSEEGENLTALAHARRLLRFRRAVSTGEAQ